MAVRSKKKTQRVAVEEEADKACKCGKILESNNSTRSSREHGLCSACYCGSGIRIHPDTDAGEDITEMLA